MDRAMAAASAGFEFPLKSFKLNQGEWVDGVVKRCGLLTASKEKTPP